MASYPGERDRLRDRQDFADRHKRTVEAAFGEHVDYRSRCATSMKGDRARHRPRLLDLPEPWRVLDLAGHLHVGGIITVLSADDQPDRGCARPLGKAGFAFAQTVRDLAANLAYRGQGPCGPITAWSRTPDFSDARLLASSCQNTQSAAARTEQKEDAQETD